MDRVKSAKETVAKLTAPVSFTFVKATWSGAKKSLHLDNISVVQQQRISLERT